MQALLNKTLVREFSKAKQELLKNDQTGSNLSILVEMEARLTEAFSNAVRNSEKKSSDSKSQLKNKTKAYSDLKSKSDRLEAERQEQIMSLHKELERSKRKSSNLLKQLEAQQTSEKKVISKPTSDFEAQCDLEDERYEKILDSIKKQNIYLSKHIVQLQELIRTKDSDIDARNILIAQLIQEVEENNSERQTRMSAYSGSDRHSYTRDFSQSQGSQRQSETEDEIYQFQSRPTDFGIQTQWTPGQQFDDNPSCGRETPHDVDQDISTVDGSCVTNKDFALPEWLQFDQPSETSIEKILPSDIDDHQTKTWPQLLWNRITCYFQGSSNQKNCLC